MRRTWTIQLVERGVVDPPGPLADLARSFERIERMIGETDAALRNRIAAQVGVTTMSGITGTPTVIISAMPRKMNLNVTDDFADAVKRAGQAIELAIKANEK